MTILAEKPTIIAVAAKVAAANDSGAIASRDYSSK
jgi:hypothetical protein